MTMLKELLSKGNHEKRNTEAFVDEMNRFMKHWYPSDEYEEMAEDIVKQKIEEIESKKTTVSDASLNIDKNFTDGIMGITIRSLWYTMLSECDIELGLNK